MCWVLQSTHTSFGFDFNSCFSLCPEIDCLTLTNTQGDAVLVKLCVSGGKVNVQLLTSRAAVTQVSADANSLFVVDLLIQITGRSLCRDNLRHLLVQEKTIRRKEAAARLQHSEG